MSLKAEVSKDLSQISSLLFVNCDGLYTKNDKLNFSSLLLRGGLISVTILTTLSKIYDVLKPMIGSDSGNSSLRINATVTELIFQIQLISVVKFEKAWEELHFKYEKDFFLFCSNILMSIELDRIPIVVEIPLVELKNNKLIINGKIDFVILKQTVKKIDTVLFENHHEVLELVALAKSLSTSNPNRSDNTHWSIDISGIDVVIEHPESHISVHLNSFQMENGDVSIDPLIISLSNMGQIEMKLEKRNDSYKSSKTLIFMHPMTKNQIHSIYEYYTKDIQSQLPSTGDSVYFTLEILNLFIAIPLENHINGSSAILLSSNFFKYSSKYDSLHALFSDTSIQCVENFNPNIKGHFDINFFPKKNFISFNLIKLEFTGKTRKVDFGEFDSELSPDIKSFLRKAKSIFASFSSSETQVTKEENQLHIEFKPGNFILNGKVDSNIKRVFKSNSKTISDEKHSILLNFPQGIF
jgi:uncharacterized protein (UPF0216 family)